jgi:hypothetical protein
MNISTEDRHSQIMNALKQYRSEHHVSPNFRELMELTGIPSTSQLKYYLLQMEDAGLISYPRGVARSIVPMDELNVEA